MISSKNNNPAINPLKMAEAANIKPKTSSIPNSVLTEDARISENFFSSDLILQHYLKNKLSADARKYMNDKLDRVGGIAATELDEHSLLADKNGPELIKRDPKGNTIDHIRFHPSYARMLEIAVQSEMFHVKWEPQLRRRFTKERNSLGFSAGYLFAMGEMGLYCPLCMTDGAARLIDRFIEEPQRSDLLARIHTLNADDLFTGAMFLTEKSGGSDVGANLVTAEKTENGEYLLNGEKWFCSNANADIIFALARTDATIPGLKGLSIFLIKKHLNSGEKNPIDVIRLKEKLGVRSMASAECMLTDTRGQLVGNEFGGFAVMAEMINLSRIYTAMGSLSGSRRALIEAYQFLNFRKSFGKTAIEHPLIRKKLEELGAMHVANFYLVWRSIEALDNAENGDEQEAELLRLITPMSKKWVSENAVYMTRESMELMGGIGYIEDGVMPKILRDLLVNPIWEGAGNIMILDMLRAVEKTNSFEVLCNEIETSALANKTQVEWLMERLQELTEFYPQLIEMENDLKETSAKLFFDRLTKLYQISLLARQKSLENCAWIALSMQYLKSAYTEKALAADAPLSSMEIGQLIAWEF